MALPAGRYGVTKAMLDYLDAGGGGGGNYTIVESDVDVSGSAVTKVTLDFKPDILLVYGENNSNHMFFIYDSDCSSSIQIRNWDYLSYKNNVAVWAVPYTGAETNGIKSIDDDGFTLLPYHTDYGTSVHYLALKRKGE